MMEEKKTEKKREGLKEEANDVPALDRYSHLWVFGLYFLLMTVVTFPLLFYWKSRIPGHFGCGEQDYLMMLYLAWKKCFFETLRGLSASGFSLGAVGTFIREISHFSTDLNIGAQFPFPIMMAMEPLTGFPGNYNVFLMLTFVLNGFCFFLLTDHLYKDRTVAIFTGVFFSISPYILFHMSELRIEQFNMFCIPLFFLYLIRLMEEEREQLKNAVLCGLFLGLTSLFYWYYGMFAVFFALVFITYRLVKSAVEAKMKQELEDEKIDGELPEVNAPDPLKRKWKKTWKKTAYLAISAVVFWIIILPFAVPYIEMLNPDRPHGYAVNQRGYFKAPGKDVYFQRKSLSANVPIDGIIDQKMTYTIPVGYTLLAIASLAFIDGIPGTWYVGWIFYYVLSLGPYFKFGDKFIEPNIINPLYYVFYQFVPFAPRFQWPDRFLSFTLIFTIIIGGYFLVNLRKEYSRYGKYATVGLAVLALSWNVFILANPSWQAAGYIPLKTSRVYIPKVYKTASDYNKLHPDNPVIVLDLPFSPIDKELYDYYNKDYFLFMRAYYASNFTHYKSVNPKLRRLASNNRLIKSLVLMSKKGRVNLAGVSDRDINELRDQGIKYIALHESMFLDFFNRTGQSLDYQTYRVEMVKLFGRPVSYGYEFRQPWIPNTPQKQKLVVFEIKTKKQRRNEYEVIRVYR